MKSFEDSLSSALEDVIMSYDGSVMGDALIAEITDELNRVSAQVYQEYNRPEKRVAFTTQYTSFLLTVMAASGAIRFKTPKYVHFDDIKPSDPTAHDPRLLQDEEDVDDRPENPIPFGDDMLYDAGPTPPNSHRDYALPEGFADNLKGNINGHEWAVKFKEMLDYNPRAANDLSILTGWFANAIMVGYDAAKQEDHPYAEISDYDLVYVEFYNHSGPGHPRNVVATLKFPNLESAKTFVKFNGYGKNFDAQYVEFYEMTPLTTYRRTKIE